jgi:hypothetical protein
MSDTIGSFWDEAANANLLDDLKALHERAAKRCPKPPPIPAPKWVIDKIGGQEEAAKQGYVLRQGSEYTLWMPEESLRRIPASISPTLPIDYGWLWRS